MNLVKCLLILFIQINLFAFCGFYVAQGDTKLFNKASKVVLVRDEDKTILTMSNDFSGDLKDFAIVVPVPTVLEKEQIHIGNNAIVEHLDNFSAPRLVEYYDEDPCNPRPDFRAYSLGAGMPELDGGKAKQQTVKIEAEYTIGEYDIKILSASESSGLVTWLTENNYKVPELAKDVLGSYIKQNLKFFVAKVNLKEQAKLGYNFLRPIQIAYESPKFMLPIRLGMVNAKDFQDLFIFAITRTGRVESSNYKQIKLPESVNIPEYIKDDFKTFYKSTFDHLYETSDKKSVFLEYAWDMGSCDPCSAEPLSNQELKELGVFWINENFSNSPRMGFVSTNAFLTRLHVRYEKDNFPEDLNFQTTNDLNSFQSRFVINHPYTGEMKCKEGEKYKESLASRKQEEVVNVNKLTGVNIEDIKKKVGITGEIVPNKWWKQIW